MNENEKKILNEKINYFFNNKTLLHINLKSGKFLNGIIIEISALFFIFNDRLEGDQPIFLSEIDSISPYKDEKWEQNYRRILLVKFIFITY